MYTYRDGIETARLKTHYLTKEDVRDWASFFEDEESQKYIPRFDMKDNTAIADFWIERQMDRYKAGRYGLQALVDKQSKRFVGLCGLLAQEVDGKIELEIGYHILREFWGQGYAPEAARAFMEYAFDELHADSVISIIDVDNVKSQRVAEKNGLECEKRTTWKGMEIFVYRKKNKNR